MESDLKRSDVSRKSFRIPQKLKRAPAPPTTTIATITMTTTTLSLAGIPSNPKNNLTTPKTDTTTVNRLRNSAHSLNSKTSSTLSPTYVNSLLLKTFQSTDYANETIPIKSQSLKLSDILNPSQNEVINDKNNINDSSVAERSNSPKTSLDVLKELENHINQIEINEKIKQTFSNESTKLAKVTNQYANQQNLMNAGLSSNSTVSGCNIIYSPDDENKLNAKENINSSESGFFQRGIDARLSTGGAFGMTIKSNAKQLSPCNPLSKPVLRTVSDTKSAEHSAQKLRFGLLNKQISQQSKIVNSKQSNGSSPLIANSPLSPTTNKNKENAVCMDKNNDETSVSAVQSNHLKLSHSSSLKRHAESTKKQKETLRHTITPTNSERSAKDNKKYHQVNLFLSPTVLNIKIMQKSFPSGIFNWVYYIR